MFIDRKSTSNALLVHSSVTEVVNTLLLILLYSERLQNIYFDGRWGYLMCQAVDSGTINNACARLSSTSLVVITLERYLKVNNSLTYLLVSYKCKDNDIAPCLLTGVNIMT